MFKFLMLLAALSCFLWSCSDALPVKDFQLQANTMAYHRSVLRNNDKDTLPFDLCSFIKGSWDTIVFVTPYLPEGLVESLNISNYGAVKKFASNQSMNEATCTLLFVRGSQYIGYSVINRINIDFSTLSRGAKEPPLLFKKSDCDLVELRKISDNYYTVVFKQQYPF